MPTEEGRRYGIAEVSKMTEVVPHVLRQWERRFRELVKPKRDRANRRYYLMDDVNTIRRIKELVEYENLTTEGVISCLKEEAILWGRPKTRQEMVDLLDTIEQEVRNALDLLTPQ